MKYGKQIVVAPQPKAVEKLHAIDKSIVRLAREIDGVQRAKLSDPEKWQLIKYKLGNYLGLMSQVRKPYLDRDEDEDEGEDAYVDIPVKEEPKNSLKINPLSPYRKPKINPLSPHRQLKINPLSPRKPPKNIPPTPTKKKISRPSYPTHSFNLRPRKWQALYK